MDVDLTSIPLPILLVGLELPAVLALVDCTGRSDDDFADGAEGKRAWRRWLVVAAITVPVLVGYLVIAGYYQSVVRRTSARGR